MPCRSVWPAFLAGLIGAVLGCSRPESHPEPAMSTPEEPAAGWRPLFDGKTTAGWRGFKTKTLPAGWRVVDGALTRVAQAGDIASEEEFQDFELALEWKVAPGGNSGIFYRVSEAPELEYVWQSGPEMQVLDDARHKDGQRPETSAGACYGLYPAPRGVVRPAGEWNQVRILVQGNHVEHWLNQRKVVEYELGSPDWQERVRRSKFAEMPRYGREPRGHLALQDHGDWVAYRNIRIRVLGAKAGG
jgi:Domain of Unknown Function (DUF1080)